MSILLTTAMVFNLTFQGTTAAGDAGTTSAASPFAAAVFTAPQSSAAAVFPDLAGHWAAAQVDRWPALGLIAVVAVGVDILFAMFDAQAAKVIGNYKKYANLVKLISRFINFKLNNN